jgi:hypothetical protein
MISFEGVTATRFSLEGNEDVVFDEINLADAEYEP